MSEILIPIKDYPVDGKPCRLTLYAEGGVIQNLDDRSVIVGKWKALKTHGDLKDFNDIVSIFDKVIYDVDDDTNALLADLLVKIGYAPTVIEAKDDCDCTAPDCLDCERNDACNSIGIERLWEDKDKNE